MESKKYYWLKLDLNFFDKEEIKLIEGMPNGKDYIIFYMKLLLKSANTNGKLMFRNVIPYTVEMLSRVTNTNPDTVRTATDLFVQLGMMQRLDDGALFILETEKMVGCETEYARKKREYREKKSSILLDIPKTKKDNVRQEIEIEKEIEKDINNTTSSKDDEVCFEDFWNIYDKKRGKKKSLSYWKKKKFTLEKAKEVIEIVKKYVSNTDKQYRKDPERYIRDNCWEDEVIIKKNTQVSIASQLEDVEDVDEWENWRNDK